MQVPINECTNRYIFRRTIIVGCVLTEYDLSVSHVFVPRITSAELTTELLLTVPSLLFAVSTSMPGVWWSRRPVEHCAYPIQEMAFRLSTNIVGD